MSKYVKQTEKSVDQVLQDLQQSIQQHGFGVLHTYDFKSTLESKGFPIDHACHVLEICSPKQASEVLKRDLSVALALPCRISVYEEDGKTVVGTILPTDLLKLVSNCDELIQTANEVEQTVKSIIDSAV